MLTQTYDKIGFGCQIHLFAQRLFSIGFEVKTLIIIPIFCEVCLQQENI